MSKRLTLLFCLLLAFAFAVPAFAAVQNVKVSGDILGRYISRNNFDLTKEDAGESDKIAVWNSVTRVRVDADLTDNVSTAVRLINERDWNEADSQDTDIDLDLAYVSLKEILCSPVSVTLGRQEIHFGNDMIVGDFVGGTPTGSNVKNGVYGTNQTTNYVEANGYTDGVNGDLSLRKSVDAVRGTINLDPLVIDIVYAQLAENNATGLSTPNDDEYLWGTNAGFQMSDKWNTLLEGYFWGKVNDSSDAINDVDGDGSTKAKADTVYTYGGRIATSPMKTLNLQQEIAFQFGKRVNPTSLEGQDRSAWASQTMATVTPGWKWDPMIGVIYSYFSGDANTGSDDADKDYHAWDPMFENQTAGHIINAIMPQSNCHNIDFMAKVMPFEDITLRADYIMQFMAKGSSSGGELVLNDYDGDGNEYDDDAKTIGYELDLNLLYDYTEDVQFGLLMGWLWPGNAYAEDNDGNKQNETATEAIASCNVKF